MQERNFEKQVQQKMEELSFVPSEPVWQKVQDQIRKKRERRKFLFWLLPCLLLTGGLYFWTSHSGIENKTISSLSTPAVSTPSNFDKSSPKTALEPPAHDSSVNFHKKPIKGNDEVPNIKTGITTVQPTNTQNVFPAKHKGSEGLTIQPSKHQKPTINSLANNTKDKKDENALITNNASIKSKEQNQNQQQKNDKGQSIPAAGIESVKDSMKSIQPTKEIDTAQTNYVKSDSVKAIRPIVKKKWNWSLHAAAGFSGVFAVGSNAKQAASPSASDLLTYNGNAFQPAAPAPASDISEQFNGFAFSIGADLGRTISKRLRIKAGLQYDYLSTYNYVGKSVNNATQTGRLNQMVDAGRFYLATTTEEEKYTNRYHFLTIPLGVDWQLLKKLPLELQGGVRVSRLIATNALYYDTKQHLFYEDDSHFNKTQFFVHGALLYRVKAFKPFSVYAGPQAQMSLSHLMKDEASGKQRLFFAGLAAQVRF